MVKGVNKTIIEINETGNEIFEKVILYVRPHCSLLNKKELERAAEVVLRDYDFEDYEFDLIKKRPSSKRSILIFSGVLVFLIITALLIIIF